MPENWGVLRKMPGSAPAPTPSVNPFSGQYRPDPNLTLDKAIPNIANAWEQYRQTPFSKGLRDWSEPVLGEKSLFNKVANTPGADIFMGGMSAKKPLIDLVKQAEKLLAKGYTSGHTLADMTPIVREATGLGEGDILNIANRLQQGAGKRIPKPGDIANRAALSREGATLKQSPMAEIALNPGTEGIAAIAPGNIRRVRQATITGEAAEREAFVAKEAGRLPNDFTNAPKATPSATKLKSGENIGTAIQRLAADEMVSANQLLKDAPQIKGIKGVNSIETMLGLFKGASWTGLQQARDTFRTAGKALGKVSADRLDDLLQLRHNLTIFEMDPNRGRVLFRNAKGTVDSLDKLGVEVKLKQLRDTLGADYPAVENAAKIVTDHYNTLLQRWADAGGIPQELVTYLRNKYPWYNPIDYVDILSKVGSDYGQGLPQFVKKLAPQGANQIIKRPLEVLATETIKREKAIQQNLIRKTIADAVDANPEIAKGWAKGVEAAELKYRAGGVEKSVVAPKYLAEAVENFFGAKDPNIIMKWVAILQDISRAGMTHYNPAFYLPNFAIDTFTALMTQRVSPLSTAKNLGKNLWYVGRDNPMLEKLNRAGAAGGNISAFEIEKQVAKGNIVLDGRKGWKKVVGVLDDINAAFEMAPRAAAYEAALKRGFTEPQAALFARRVTIDFARGGQAVKALNTVFLFLNAAVQGAMIIPRSFRTSPKRATALTAGFSASLAGLYAYNSQYPEYYDVPEYLRKGSLLVMLPSDEYDKDGKKVPHYLTIIPALREFSLLQGPIVSVGDVIKQKDPQGLADFANTMWTLTSPAANVVETGSAGAYIPVPTQVGRTLLEAGTNYDPFRQRPIVSDYMKEQAGGQKSQEFNQYTSTLARRVGELTSFLPGDQQWSPQVVDYIIRNLGGGTAQALVSIYDGIDKFVAGVKQYDPEMVKKATELHAIQSKSAPEDIKLDRQIFLDNLDPATRKQVTQIENLPEFRIPIISTIINRFYREYGGRQEDINMAQAKAYANLPGPKEPTTIEEGRNNVIKAVDAFNSKGIDKRKLDAEITKAKSFLSGAKSQMYEGMVFPTIGQPQYKQAINDYFALWARYSGDFLDSKEYKVAEQAVNKELKAKGYSEKVLKYVEDNKLAWIKDFPEKYQKFLRDRNAAMENGTWWKKTLSGSSYNGPATPYTPKVPTFFNTAPVKSQTVYVK